LEEKLYSSSSVTTAVKIVVVFLVIIHLPLGGTVGAEVEQVENRM